MASDEEIKDEGQDKPSGTATALRDPPDPEADAKMDEYLARMDKEGVEDDGEEEEKPEEKPGKPKTEAKDENQDAADDEDDKKGGKDDEDEDADKGPDLTPRQKQIAKQFDVTPDEIAQMGDAAGAMLERMASKLDRHFGKLGQQAEKKAGKGKTDGKGDEDAASDEDQDQAAKGKAKAKDSEKPRAVDEDDADLPELKTYELDALYDLKPEHFNTPIRHLQRQAERIRGLEDQIAAIVENLDGTEITGHFQELIGDETKGDEYRTVFGEDPKAWMDAGEHSPAEAQTMARVVAEARAIRRGVELAGGEAPSLREACRRATAYVAQDAIKAAERRRGRDQQRKRDLSRSFRPNSRRPAGGKSREQRADDRVAAKAEELGIRLED